MRFIYYSCIHLFYLSIYSSLICLFVYLYLIVQTLDMIYLIIQRRQTPSRARPRGSWWEKRAVGAAAEANQNQKRFARNLGLSKNHWAYPRFSYQHASPWLNHYKIPLDHYKIPLYLHWWYGFAWKHYPDPMLWIIMSPYLDWKSQHLQNWGGQNAKIKWCLGILIWWQGSDCLFPMLPKILQFFPVIHLQLPRNRGPLSWSNPHCLWYWPPFLVASISRFCCFNQYPVAEIIPQPFEMV